MRASGTIRVIAFIEALKGIVVLLVATGLVSMMHRDVHALAVRLVEHAHLNPASRYPQIFIDAASELQNARLLMLALGAAAYSVIRLIESYGLYRERVWAELLAAGSGAIYVPMELVNLWRRPTGLSLALLAINVLIVIAVVRALQRRRSGAEN